MIINELSVYKLDFFETKIGVFNNELFDSNNNSKIDKQNQIISDLESTLKETQYLNLNELSKTTGKYVSCQQNKEGTINDASDSFYITNKIYVEEGTHIEYKLYGYNNVICVISAFKENEIFSLNDSIYYTSSAGSGTSVSFEGEYVVPSNIKYIIIGEYDTHQDSFVRIPTKVSKLNNIETNIEELNVKYTSIELSLKDTEQAFNNLQSSLTFDNSQYEEVNITKDGFDTWDYGYIRPNGTISTATSGSYKYSPKFYIKKDSTITIKQIYGNTAIASVAAYTENDTFVQECSYIGNSIMNNQSPHIIDTTDYNISYIRITYGGGFGNYNVYVFIGEESILSIQQKINLVENDYNTKIENVVDKIENIGIANPWKGKTWVALGTSITDTSNTLAPDGTCTGKYIPYLKEYGEFGTLENKGVAGTIVGSHMLYYASHAQHLADADLVTIEGFVNDWAGGRTLGKVGDTIPYHISWSSPVWDNGGNDETGTFTGAVYKCLNTIVQNAPKAKVVLITDNTGKRIPSTGADCARETLKNGHTQKDYTDMAIEVAHYLGIEVINAGQESQINQDHPEYLIDQIHQTELGGKQFAKTIWSKLKNIQPLITE